jgi:hypothetical protein
MSNQIKWSFEGLPTVYTTEEARLETTAVSLRRLNKLHAEHKIQIISREDGIIESIIDDAPTGDSGSNPKEQHSVSEHTEAVEAVDETIELQPLLDNLGDTDTESDVL